LVNIAIEASSLTIPASLRRELFLQNSGTTALPKHDTTGNTHRYAILLQGDLFIRSGAVYTEYQFR